MTDMTRALSFGEIADRYGRYRPAVPAPAVEWLLPDGGDTVVDLGAGTGALTRTLMSSGRVGRVVAVEPDRRMGKLFTQEFPDVQLLSGTAESMPLPADSADAVLIAMAWHWVEADRAMPEIARVLRPGGTFGVLWNHRDLSVQWVSDLDRFTRAARARARGGARGGVAQAARRDVLDPQPGVFFSAFRESHVTWFMSVTARELVGHLSTDASAIALSAEDRNTVDEQVLAYLRDELGLSGDQRIELPMDCRCLRATRRSNATLDPPNGHQVTRIGQQEPQPTGDLTALS